VRELRLPLDVNDTREVVRHVYLAIIDKVGCWSEVVERALSFSSRLDLETTVRL
jgi:hypothetical protein